MDPHSDSDTDSESYSDFESDLFRERYMDDDNYINDDMFDACDREDYKKIDHMIENGVNINNVVSNTKTISYDTYYTLLHFVGKCENFGYNHYKMVKFLIENG